jgi:flagellar biosynthesis chaperone FliJ
MKSLKTLIKLSKNKLDKTLLQIDRYEKEKSRLESKKLLLDREIEEEISKYSRSQYAYMLDRYMDNTRRIIQRIDAQILQISSSIDRLRTILYEQYSELKKFELALEHKNRQGLEKIKKIEEKIIDEFNINRIIR